MATEKHEAQAEQDAENGTSSDGQDASLEEAGDISIEELVPGLEDEISRQEAQDIGATIIAELEEERDALRDKWTRALAEAENTRRRAERDRKDAETYGGTRLARDLLSVYDNLERALRAADDNLRDQAQSFIEGVELTQRELLNAFSKHKIEKVTPEIGERFDPNRHQAMFEAPIPGAEPGTIIETMQDGFVIADRLLRPALVGIAKSVSAESGQAPEEPTSDHEADAADPTKPANDG